MSRLLLILAGLFGDAGPAHVVDLIEAPTGAVFWPRGFGLQTDPDPSHRDRRLAVLDLTGRELPARFEVVTRWPDGSPRWWRVTPGEWSGVGRVQVESVSRPPRGRAPSLRTTRRGWSFAPRPGRDLATWENGTLSIGRPRDRVGIQLGRMSVEADGLRATAQDPTAELRTGPDAAGLGLELQVPFEEVCPVHSQVRVAVSSSARFLALELCLTALHPTSVRRWTVPVTVEGTTARLEGLGQRLDADGPRSVSLQAPRASIGEAAVPDPSARLQIGLGGQALHLYWPQFALRRPAAVTLSEDGTARLHLVDDDVFLDRGQTIRRRLWLGRGGADALAHGRPRCMVRPRVRPSLAVETRAWLEAWAAFLRNWIRQRTWMEDFGCYPTRYGSFANGEYDLGASLLELGRLLGDAELVDLGEQLVRHTMDWDVAVDVPDPWPEGLFAHHGDRHASDRVEAGHMWVDGFLELHKTSGATDGYGTARRVGAALADARAHGSLFEGPERRLAWPLRVALDLQELSTERTWSSLANSLVREFGARQTPGGFLDGDRRRVGAGERIWVNVWVALGISIDALLQTEREFGSRSAGQVAADYGHFVVDAALRDGVLAEVLLVDPASGVVEERRGRCRKGGAALAAAGLNGLARRGNDPLLFATAEELWQKALADLARPQERDLVEWAKSLQALRRRIDLAARDGPPASANR